MSKAEKIVRLIICLTASMLIVACFAIFMNYIKIENHALETFMHIAFPSSVGWLCGNSMNNTLSLPDKKDEDKK